MRQYPAAAKINLALHVTGRRNDGYHLLDTLVAFADCGDTISVTSADDISLMIDGPFANQLDDSDNNLVIRAANLLSHTAMLDGIVRPGAVLRLTKWLPIASGIGGGSADAAAALLALCNLWHLDPRQIDLAEIAGQLGADVPMCLQSRPLLAGGIGEKIKPVSLPALNMVLVNPGTGVSTADIFRSLSRTDNAGLPVLPDFCGETGFDALLDWLETTRNDLQPPALEVAPQIRDVLEALRQYDDCRFARMSGSGATCFGLFASLNQAAMVADDLSQRFPSWWCVASKSLGRINR